MNTLKRHLHVSGIHASGLKASAKIWPIEFQNQQAAPIKSLAFWPVDGRPHPVSGSMVFEDFNMAIVGCCLPWKYLYAFSN